MKRIVLLVVLFLCLPLKVKAKVRMDVIRNGGFTELSTEDMQDTCQALADKIAKDCKVKPQTISCYDWPESPILAYNTLWGCNIICVNLSGFRTTEDADLAGETVEYHLVKTLAHEVRHSYQWEHRLDDTEYGRSCLQGFNSYQNYDGDKASYYAQFTENDAEQWAIEYANKYKVKK